MNTYKYTSIHIYQLSVLVPIMFKFIDLYFIICKYCIVLTNK